MSQIESNCVLIVFSITCYVYLFPSTANVNNNNNHSHNNNNNNNKNNIINEEVWFDEKPEYENLQRLSRNVTRCTTTELSLQKETFLHNWEINGLFQYLEHSKKFNQSFEVCAEDVTFKSNNINGKWFFKISRTISTINLVSDIKVTSSYSYEAKYPNKISFGILFSIVFDQEEIVLPIQTSTNLPLVVVQPPLQQQQQRSTKYKGNPMMEYKYNFNWPNLSELENMTNFLVGSGSSSSSIEDGNYNNIVLLRFIITAYYPNPIVSSRTDACRERVVRDFITKKTNNGIPPFLKYTSSMLNDDRYFDLVIRSGNEEFLAHRIILASSSPVFSSLLFNESNVQPRNETSRLQIDDDISPEAVEEMLRYLYTGKVEKLKDTVQKIIILAHRFQLPELKEICEEYILSKVHADNAMILYHLGLEVNSSQLVAKSFEVIKANKIKIFPTTAEYHAFNQKHPSLMFDLFQAV